jgi:hypothetical protein
MAAGDKKRVRLMMGDGPDRVEIGEAEVEELPDGTFKINIILEDGSTYAAEIPKLPWLDGM